MHNARRARLVGLAIASLAMVCRLAGCSEPTASSVPPLEWRVEPEASSLEVGFEQQFDLVPAGGPPDVRPTLPVAWGTSAPSVATVDPGGLARGVGPGTTYVRAFVDGTPVGEGTLTVAPLRMTEVSAGEFFTCGVSSAAVAYCWGRGAEGALGVGDRDDRLIATPAVSEVRFASVNGRYEHTCGVALDGTAYCWGENVVGRLGTGPANGSSLVPERVASTVHFVTVAAGGWFTCGVATDALVYCWGANDRGSVGDSTSVDRYSPVPVGGGREFAAVTAGGLHACGVTVSHDAYCWGANNGGQLGDGTVLDRPIPTPVAGNLKFTSISAAVAHTCGVTEAGDAYCWGDNYRGKLGAGELEGSLVPVKVVGGEKYQSIVTGLLFSCALTIDGRVYCWGGNLGHALGRPMSELDESPVPLLLPGDRRYTSISATGTHTCGIAEDGLTYCWGANPWGQLGVGVYSFGSAEALSILGQVAAGVASQNSSSNPRSTAH